MKLTKTSTKIRLGALALIASLLLTLLSHERAAFAQGGFEGDYDYTFGGGDGYYVDPESPVAPANDTYQTYFHTGELLPDGSIIAGGRHVDNAPRGDFYMRKFTASGAIDTSFGTGGYVRTTFHTQFDGVAANDIPQVLKVQPDGKILFAGQCDVLQPNAQSAPFGTDACVIRYNANGTLDQTFGGGTLVYNTYGTTNTVELDPGKVIFQTGVAGSGRIYGLNGIYYDMAIQPDGKIVLVGEVRDEIAPFNQGSPTLRFSGIIVRLNPNGTRDTTFGSNGIARWSMTEFSPGCGERYSPRIFFGMRLQPDGRIIAVGYDGITNPNSCSIGTRFVVTRWTAAGQLETVRYITGLANLDVSFTERAFSAHLTRDGGKLLVSGSARNLSGSGRQKPTMARFNISDLSLDASFGSGGIAQYNVTFDNWTGSTLFVKAIQPDGKIIGTDNAFIDGNYVRLNADGSPDLSFGNLGIDGSPGAGGRLRVLVQNFNGVSAALNPGQILVRPNGRINLVGSSNAHTGQGIVRAVVSQQNTELPSFTLSGRVLAGSGATAPGVAGVTVKLTGSKTVTTTTNSNGHYSFANLYMGGNFTVTPSKPGYSLIPSSKSVTNISADQLNVNFFVPALSVNNLTVTETNPGATAAATFTIKLSPASPETVTIKFKTANGTAVYADYVARPLTQLTFSPGQTSKTVTVQVKGDALDEGNETFKLVLSEPTKALILDNEGICTITDNDPLPTITVSDASVTEPDSGTVAASFTVWLSAASGRTVTVKYATGGGLSGSIATAGTDYVAVPLTILTFAPGQTTKTVVVQVKGDTVKEANETYFVNLSGAVNGAITDAKGLGTILNDD